MRLKGYASGGVVGGSVSTAGPMKGMTVNIHNNAPVEVETKQGVDDSGKPTLEVFVKQVKQSIAADMVKKQGPVYQATKQTFGLRGAGS